MYDYIRCLLSLIRQSLSWIPIISTCIQILKTLRLSKNIQYLCQILKRNWRYTIPGMSTRVNQQMQITWPIIFALIQIKTKSRHPLCRCQSKTQAYNLISNFLCSYSLIPCTHSLWVGVRRVQVIVKLIGAGTYYTHRAVGFRLS